MHYLNTPCRSCKQPMNGGVYRLPHLCPHCGFDHRAGVQAVAPLNVVSAQAVKKVIKKTAAVNKPSPGQRSIAISAKPSSSFNDHIPMKKLQTKCALKFALSPDMFAEGKFIGSKHKVVLAAMNQGKKKCLDKLRESAMNSGAQVVADVNVKTNVEFIDKTSAKLCVSSFGTALSTNKVEA